MPISSQVSPAAPVTALRREIRKLMKTQFALMSAAVCGIFAATSIYGQATIVWSGAADGTNLVNATNWVGNVLPNNANADTAEWNGLTTSNLVLHYNSSTFAGYAGQSGIGIYITAAQANSVQLMGDLASPGYMAIGDINIEANAGSFILGNTNPATRFDVICRPSGAVKAFMNNSTNPAIINPYVRWAGGSGAVWTHDYMGSGNWYVTNYLVNDNGPGMNIQVDGPGTMYWSPSVPTTYQANGIQSPVVINNGTMVLQWPHPKLGGQAFTLNGTFIFDSLGQAQTLTGIFSGSGTNIVNNGTLTLSGQSTYTGDTVLQGGELIVNGTENAGTAGPLGMGMIDFNGGVLGFSLNNTFDYSPRFNTAAGQQYKIDTAGFNVTFTNALSSSGGTFTKLGAGNLTLAGISSYSGLTTVNGGKLIFQGTKTGSGSITLADGAALDVYSTGTPMTPTTLTVGSSSGGYLEFDSVNSTTTAPIAAGSVTTPGVITVNINSGTFAVGSSYPLFSWSSGSAPAVSLGILNGYIGSLTTNGSTITLNIQATAFKWTGNNNNSWDLTTANNWLQNGGPVVFSNGAPALLDDTAAGNQNITITGVLLPTLVSFNTGTSNYVITSSSGNDIGSGNLLKAGSGMVTLAGGANTYTGITTVSGGTLSVGTLANGGSPSDIGAASSDPANLVLNGGTLLYTGSGASIDRAFSVTPAGGVLDGSGSGALAITAPGVGLPTPGPRTLTLAGTNAVANTLASVISNNIGATALIKNGTGTWILSSNNTYSGLTTVNNGVLQIGADGANGTLGTGNILNNSRLDFHRTGTVTVSGNITGTGAVTNDGTGTVVLAGNNNYQGGTFINAGAVQVGNGGSSGSLYGNGNILMTNNSTFIFNSKTALGISGYLTGVQGQGNLIVRANCTFSSIDANTYTGWTLIESGASFQPCVGNEGELLSSVITNNGTLLFMRQDQLAFGYTNNIVGSGKVVTDVSNFGDGWTSLVGTNTYTGGTWIKGGGIVLGDGVTPGAGSIFGPVIFTNTATPYHDIRTLVFNRPDDFTFTNPVITAVTDGTAVNDEGRLAQYGTGVVILTGNVSYPGLTTIIAGTLQFGNGGTSGCPSTLAAITNNGTVVFDRSDAITVSGIVSDGYTIGYPGSLVQLGSGTVTLSAMNTYGGPTTVSNGTLVVSASYIGGDLKVEGGTIVPAVPGTASIVSIGGNVNLDSGTVVATLNKSVALVDTNFSVTVSNTFFSVTNLVNLTAGTITATGGSLKLINAGPALVAGDKFTIFSGPVTGGALMTIVSPGFTVNNNLAVDGSVTVTGVQPAPTLTPTMVGNQLNLTWPAAWSGGVHLQGQTNSLAKGLGTNWVTIPGTDAGNTYSATVNRTNGSVFYRLIAP